MPFKSEKQRRYLWAEHPEIAKEWADKYPESNKNLPMYANKKKSPGAHIPESQTKSASINISNLVNRYVNNCKQHGITTANTTMSKTDKTADSKQERVDIPHSSQPVYAGEEREKGKIEGEIPTGMNVGESCEQKPKNAINELLTKLSVVLSPHIEQTMENLEAEREGRVPRRIAKNRGVKQYPCGGINIMPPMGLAQNPQQNQQSQPNNQYPSRPVGGGSHPQFNPIQAFGALSVKGEINGNAAFGAKNSPDSSKIAAIIKRANRSEALGKVLDINTVDPDDIEYYDEEYVEELSQRKAASESEDALEHDLPPEKKPEVQSPSLLTAGLVGAGAGLSAFGLSKALDAYGISPSKLIQPHLPDAPDWLKNLGGKQASWNLLFKSLRGAGAMRRFVAPAAQAAARGTATATTSTPAAVLGQLLTRGVDGLALRMHGKTMSVPKIMQRYGEALARAQAGKKLTPRLEKYMQLGDRLRAGKIKLKGLPSGFFDDEPALSTNTYIHQMFTGRLANAFQNAHKTPLARKPGKLIAGTRPPFAVPTPPESPYMSTPMPPKTARAAIEKWAQKEDHKDNNDTPCSCGCGDTVRTCKCAQSCSCRKPGGSCYKSEKKVAVMEKYSAAYVMKIARCWAGYEPVPGKKPYSEDSCRPVGSGKKKKKNDSGKSEKKAGSTPAWQRSEGKNSEGGLNAKGRASYNKATGGNLKAPVTESNPKGKRAKRQNSFCARMCGMKRVNTGAKTKSDPDSRINKSLRKWNCKCSSAMEFGVKLAGGDVLGHFMGTGNR
jgi:hypothetical protein